MKSLFIIIIILINTQISFSNYKYGNDLFKDPRLAPYIKNLNQMKIKNGIVQVEELSMFPLGIVTKEILDDKNEALDKIYNQYKTIEDYIYFTNAKTLDDLKYKPSISHFKLYNTLWYPNIDRTGTKRTDRTITDTTIKDSNNNLFTGKVFCIKYYNIEHKDFFIRIKNGKIYGAYYIHDNDHRIIKQYDDNKYLYISNFTRISYKTEEKFIKQNYSLGNFEDVFGYIQRSYHNSNFFYQFNIKDTIFQYTRDSFFFIAYNNNKLTGYVIYGNKIMYKVNDKITSTIKDFKEYYLSNRIRFKDQLEFKDDMLINKTIIYYFKSKQIKVELNHDKYGNLNGFQYLFNENGNLLTKIYTENNNFIYGIVYEYYQDNTFKKEEKITNIKDLEKLYRNIKSQISNRIAIL